MKLKFNIKGARIRDKFNGLHVNIGTDDNTTVYTLKYVELKEYTVIELPHGRIIAEGIDYPYISNKISEGTWKIVKNPFE